MEKKTTKKRKASNKGLFVALGVALALLVMVVIGAFVFLQSPERQLASGFANLIKADSVGVDGTVKATNTSGRYVTTFAAQTNKKVASGNATIDYTGDKNAKLDGNVKMIVTDNGSFYAQVDQPKKFMESYATILTDTLLVDARGEALPDDQRTRVLELFRTQLTDVGAKMEGKWIKLTQSELRQMLGGEAGTDCYITFSRTLQSNASARNDLAGAYQKYRFITVREKLEAEGTSQGYRVSIDQAKLKEFKDSVAGNEAVKKLGSCGQDILTLGASDTIADQSVDIWIDRFSQQITRIKYDKNSKDESSAVDLKLKYGVAVNVTTPQDTVDLKTVLPTFDALQSARQQQ